MARVSLTSWIDRTLNDGDKGGKCTQFSLVHILGGGQEGKELHTCRIGNGRTYSSKDIAEALQGVADGYAQDLPGTQTFQVKAFYEGSPQPLAFFHITAVQQADERTPGFTEAPTKEGRTQMDMRWQDKWLSQVFSRQQAMDNHALAMLGHFSAANIALAEQNRDMFEVFQRLALQKATEDREHSMRALEFQRSTEERRQVIRLIPPLANTLTGKEVFPQQTEDTALVEMLAENISEEQAQMFCSMMKPEAAGLFMARFHKHVAQRRKDVEELEQLKKQLPAHPDPEKDAAGEAAE